MGEFAKYNGSSVKIGTCERMYYLRWDDRHRVSPEEHSVNPATQAGLFFRLPFPDEDGIQPGGAYKDYQRGYRMGDWEPDDFADYPASSMQVSHPESGLVLNVPCHHGAKLPEVGPEIHVFWNGKNHALELCAVKAMPGGTLRPVYRCRFCGAMWSCDWEDILLYCGSDPEMLRRLKQYATVGDIEKATA